MKCFPARLPAIATVAAFLVFVSGLAWAAPFQSTPPQDKPAAPSPAPAATPPTGKVIFSRSTDENGQTTTQTGPAAAKPNIEIAKAPTLEDADRRAISISNYDLDVRLHTAAQQLVVRALVTVRNTTSAPISRIPLQISGSLNWERIRIANRDVSFKVATLNSDSDHTGQLHEAEVPLAEPLAPGATLQLDTTYSGTIPQNAQRLLSIGAPEDAALHSDWDRVSESFTGLRGFGNVVWYPVSSVPVILGDGARLFDEIGFQKLHLSGAGFQLKLTVEFPHGHAPSVAMVNGYPVALTVTNPPETSSDVDGTATASVEPTTLGFEAPSLFVAVRTPHPGANLTAWTLPADDVPVQGWLAAETAVTPFLQEWLGPKPRTELTLLDLPDPQDLPWETGAMMALSLREGPPDQLTGVLSHAMTHAWFHSPRAWLNEGVAYFISTLWVERHQGREQALSMLESSRAALAMAEPASPGEGAGQPLDDAISPVYYRTKAAYVLWMLRDLAGDEVLSAALRAYDPSQDLDPIHGSFPGLIKKSAGHRDLAWFFADWVDADRGLPDLSVQSAFPNAAQAGNWLVAVTVANAGYAAAEVPVSARSATSTVSDRVLVPAHSSAVHRLLLQGKPIEVRVNDGTVPETAASVHVTQLDQSAHDSTSATPSATPQQQ